MSHLHNVLFTQFLKFDETLGTQTILPCCYCQQNEIPANVNSKKFFRIKYTYLNIIYHRVATVISLILKIFKNQTRVISPRLKRILKFIISFIRKELFTSFNLRICIVFHSSDHLCGKYAAPLGRNVESNH